MGMSIEEAYEILYNGLVNAPSEHEWCVAFRMAIDTMRKYQQLQADYENRLKADMVAMLEDLDLQIDELGSYNREVAKVQRLIRDRIDKLKVVEDGNDDR